MSATRSSGPRYPHRHPPAGGVTLVNRVGVRMYLSIGPGGAPPSNFVIRSLAAKRSVTGDRLVVARVQNSGQRTLDISGNLTLSKGPGGLRAGPIPVKLGTALAPGESQLVNVRLDESTPPRPVASADAAQERVYSPSSRSDDHIPSAPPASRKRRQREGAPSYQLILGGVILLVLLSAAVYSHFCSAMSLDPAAQRQNPGDVMLRLQDEPARSNGLRSLHVAGEREPDIASELA